jgi:hypothetical protein
MIAFKMQTDLVVITVAPAPTTFLLYINGAATTLAVGEIKWSPNQLFSVTRNVGQLFGFASITVSTSSGAAVLLEISPIYINMDVKPPQSYFGAGVVTGLAGSWDCDQSNDMAKPDGALAASVTELGIAWRARLVGTSFFTGAFACLPGTTQTQIDTFTPATPDPAAVADATLCCKRRGIGLTQDAKDQQLLTSCIYDVAVLNDGLCAGWILDGTYQPPTNRCLAFNECSFHGSCVVTLNEARCTPSRFCFASAVFVSTVN